MERKDWLAYENNRNHHAKELYTAILREVFGTGEEVVIAHHLTFDGDNPDEIPSADTMIFDHDIARRIWGDGYLTVLAQLSAAPCDQRDALLAELYYARQAVTA